MPARTPTPSAQSLLALMQAGDLAALDALARAWGDRLLAVARRRCHLPADAEDAVQQALLTASTAMTGIRGDGDPLAWLSTLVSRTCQRLNRRVGTAEPLEDAPCGCDGPEALAERRELGAALESALMALPRLDRLLFLLAAEGFDGVELAERFALSHDAVRGRLKRARHRLREALHAADTLDGDKGTDGHHPQSGTRPHDPRRSPQPPLPAARGR
ncbi:MAG: sigma-70 family RNA polymerase sigma factor [Myxococcaceae bacterium]|nr:sigma-70 family RNA polymerase sigma factor [Myxococcaceae bacterium]